MGVGGFSTAPPSLFPPLLCVGAGGVSAWSWGPIRLRHLVLHFLHTEAHLPHGRVQGWLTPQPHHLSKLFHDPKTLIKPVPLITEPGSRRKGLICISSPSPNLSVCTVAIETGPKRLLFAVTSPSVLLQCWLLTQVLRAQSSNFHFTDEETKAQRGKATCPRAHSELAAEPT